MSLYLCVFDDDEEIDGVDVGAYSDFGHLRDTIAARLEGGEVGSRFPLFMLHSDCEGEWTVEECAKLIGELETIQTEFSKMPAQDFFSDWQKNVAKSSGLRPQNLNECFIDVDGELVLERIRNLAQLALRRSLPILFQ